MCLTNLRRVYRPALQAIVGDLKITALDSSFADNLDMPSMCFKERQDCGRHPFERWRYVLLLLVIETHVRKHEKKVQTLLQRLRRRHGIAAACVALVIEIVAILER